MADGTASLLRLMAWLSPAFPVGSFSYSHGLETAVDRGLVADADSLRGWLTNLLSNGSAWNDAVLFAEAHRRAGDGGDLVEIGELGEAMAGSHERHIETTLQGAAFFTAASAWSHGLHDALPANCPYSVAVGATAGAHGIGLNSALAAFLQGFASNQIQAAIRLSVIGQTDAMTTLAALEPLIGDTAARAGLSTLDNLGSATIMAEIVAMQHETLRTRLFRS